MEEQLNMDDVFTLIGHAEVMRMDGKTDMPAYFLDLARRISVTLGDTAMAQRCEEMAQRPPLPKEPA